MGGPLRSKQGCWTCRLRKKKCDERRPLCRTCESLSITCYGYGQKPEWMNSPEKEKEVVEGLKEIVKHTSRRKAVSHLSKQRNPIVNIAPKSSNEYVDDYSSGPASSRNPSATPPINRGGSSQEDQVDMMNDQTPESSVSVSASMFCQPFNILMSLRSIPRLASAIIPLQNPYLLSCRMSRFF